MGDRPVFIRSKVDASLDPRIIDNNIQVRMFPDEPRSHVLPRGGLGEIADVGDDVWKLCFYVSEYFGPSSADDHLITSLSKTFDESQAYPAPAAGDEDGVSS